MRNPAALLFAFLGFYFQAQANQVKSVTLIDGKGAEVGTAILKDQISGVEISLDLRNLPSGTKAIHIHEKGDCKGPDFKSAGDHLAPADQKHGKVPGGPHAGDLPNITISQNGKLKTTLKSTLVTLKVNQPNSLLRPEGAALVIHAKADDHRSQPAGDAGDRIACAVLTKPNAN